MLAHFDVVHLGKAKALRLLPGEYHGHAHRDPPNDESGDAFYIPLARREDSRNPEVGQNTVDHQTRTDHHDQGSGEMLGSSEPALIQSKEHSPRRKPAEKGEKKQVGRIPGPVELDRIILLGETRAQEVLICALIMHRNWNPIDSPSHHQ